MSKIAVIYHSTYETAELYGCCVAEITLQFVRGRKAS